MRLWLTAEQNRLVPEGHKDAAFLFSLPGQRISHANAIAYGLLDSPAAQPELIKITEPEPAPEPVAIDPDPEPKPEPVKRGPGRPRKVKE